MSNMQLLAAIADAIGRHPMIVTQGMITGFASQFLIASTLGGHHDRLVKRAERWSRGGEPVAGFGTFHGRVVAEHESASKQSASGQLDARPPVVERVRRQRLINKDVWADFHVTARADPFRLELAEGRELLVVPGEPQLSGFEETEMAQLEATREVRSALHPDERVWVTGYLEPPPRGLGAYRGGGQARKLRPPKGRALWITRLAPAEGWKKLARAHRLGAWTALGALAGSVATAYTSVLSPWLNAGPEAMPHLPWFVLLGWLLFAAVAVAVWRASVLNARSEWNKRFPWL